MTLNDFPKLPAHLSPFPALPAHLAALNNSWFFRQYFAGGSRNVDTQFATVIEMGTTDSKGRTEAKLVAIEDAGTAEEQAAQNFRAAHRYTVRVHSVRAGDKFGAFPNGTSFDTLEEAIACTLKKVAQLTKKAVQQ